MAVVTGKSNLIRDYVAGEDAPDPMVARGRLYVATGTVANAATDSSGSKYHLADLPSDCILDPLTNFKVDGWGFAQILIGTETDTNALLDVARSAATTQQPVAFGAAASHGKELWELLGMAADPGGTIGLWAHAAAGATGAGTMPFQVVYRYR